MKLRRLVMTFCPVCVAALLATATAGAATASTPPTTEPPTAEAISAGLDALLGEVGTLTYEGDDITVGECPLTDADETTTAFAVVADDVELAADGEAQIEVFVDYSMDEQFEPAGLSCDFEATADDAALESVGILLVDPAGDGVGDALDGVVSSLDPDQADEPLAIGGELRGACEEDECLFVWSGADAVIAVSVEFGADAAPELDTVSAATRELITAIGANVAGRA